MHLAMYEGQVQAAIYKGARLSLWCTRSLVHLAMYEGQVQAAIYKGA